MVQHPLTDQQLGEWLLLRMLQTHGEATEEHVQDLMRRITDCNYGTAAVAELAQGLALAGYPVAVTMIVRLEGGR